MSKFIARCRLTLHDYVYFASREMGRLYETEQYLHNYALTYALGLVQPAPAYFQNSQVPQYQVELERSRLKGVYVTPARPLRIDFSFHTFKMATVPYYSFTPQVIENRVVFGRSKELAPGSIFEFFVLADKQSDLPGWIRLGKWLAKARLVHTWYEVGSKLAQVSDSTSERPKLVSCPLNPLDIAPSRLFSYDVVAMPPVSLLTNVSVTGRYCQLPRQEQNGDEGLGRLELDERFVPLDLSYFSSERNKA